MWILWSVLASAAEPKPIEDIRHLWTETQAQIERSEAAVLALDWNAEAMAWPAVGTYEQKLRAWYVRGDDSPYPDRIVKIVAERRNAARTERHTYLYRAGELVFVLAENPEHPTVRAYWDKSLLRVQIAEAVHEAPAAAHAALATALRTEGTEAYRVASSVLTRPPSLSALETR